MDLALGVDGANSNVEIGQPSNGGDNRKRYIFSMLIDTNEEKSFAATISAVKGVSNRSIAAS